MPSIRVDTMVDLSYEREERELEKEGKGNKMGRGEKNVIRHVTFDSSVR